MNRDLTKPSATVYNFMTVNDGLELATMAPFKATREAILGRFFGLVLEGTAQQVAADELDAEGRLSRVPTGWGELPG